MDREIVDARIKSSCSALGWQTTIFYILERGIPFNEIEVAEVGCGTGTFSLMLNLLGAKTTLIDFNEYALRVARRVFEIYNRKATFIKADTLEPVPANLMGGFDVVVSGGLGEHFVGEDREKCIAFHRALLKEGGFAYIGVPNKLSIFYQMVKLFREATGTWDIKVEIPFTYWELKRLAEKVGFSRSKIVGNYPLEKDLLDYSLGLVSTVLALCPAGLRNWIRMLKSKKTKHSKASEKALPDPIRKELSNGADIVFEKTKSIKKYLLSEHQSNTLIDHFSAGIILFGFKDKKCFI